MARGSDNRIERGALFLRLLRRRIQIAQMRRLHVIFRSGMSLQDIIIVGNPVSADRIEIFVEINLVIGSHIIGKQIDVKYLSRQKPSVALGCQLQPLKLLSVRLIHDKMSRKARLRSIAFHHLSGRRLVVRRARQVAYQIRVVNERLHTELIAGVNEPLAVKQRIPFPDVGKAEIDARRGHIRHGVFKIHRVAHFSDPDVLRRNPARNRKRSAFGITDFSFRLRAVVNFHTAKL